MPDHQDHALAALMAAKPLYLKSSSLSEQIYQLLRELILERKIPGDSEMSESRLADELQVSRTPMREALVRLAGEGLLVRRGARSYAVRAVDTKEYFDSMALRELLECEAISKAVERIDQAALETLASELDALSKGEHDESSHWHFDDRLHNFIAEASGNRVLVKMLVQLRANARLFRLHSPLHRQKENHEEHLDVIDALRRRDAQAGTAAMRQHLHNLRNEVLKALSGG
ncbi:GntR family transcriptional regulator [Pseudomonas sp. nanlin1]|uniref:GntR family transcriptional regulator n=1 Tax=Pseudomonas sp. nanlin1 TaxID=3040605 RepID=UPI003890B072